MLELIPAPRGWLAQYSIALLLFALSAPGQTPGQSAPKKSENEWTVLRRQLRHDELVGRYDQARAEQQEPGEQRQIAARLATLQMERELLGRLGELTKLRGLAPGKLTAQLAALPKSGQDELTLARLCYDLGEVKQAESALARARDAAPKLKAKTDAMLAEARQTSAPRGGYHRYRGAWLSLAQRDREQALDQALEHLHGLQIDAARLPFEPSSERRNRQTFATKVPEGAAWMRTAAAAVRAAMAPDYAEVRTWLGSYSHPNLRRPLLDRHKAMVDPRKKALALIRKYDKPQQDAVDRNRAQLEKMYASWAEALRRDRARTGRLSEQAAYELLGRIRNREAALDATHRYLARYAKPGLPAVKVVGAAGAPVTKRHLLPGRAQSELEDVLWLLLHARAGQIGDVMQRGAELLRHRGKLTPWETLQVDAMLADAVDTYNELAAVSLDAEEREFVHHLNAYRRVLGLRPFEVEERLNVASTGHSQEMVDLGYFGHISPIERNRGPTDRARLEGYNGGVGENCLAGGVGGEGAFEGWYRSPGHHRNLISGGVHLGVGAVAGHSMWTMVCGGTDLSWRALHRDLPPARRAELQAAADALAASHREPATRKQAKARQQLTMDAGLALIPDVLPALAGIGFGAAGDARHSAHGASATLLGLVADADVPTVWRPLQLAAVAAAIEALAETSNAPLRKQALQIVKRHVGKTFGYRPNSPQTARRKAALEMRRHWQDQAQWRFRIADGKPPNIPNVPGRGDGPSLESKRSALTRSERLRLARRNGGGSVSEQAVDRGIAWLSRVQDEDGAWRARSFVTRSPKFNAKKAGIGSGEWGVAMTGLSLLAFTATGNTHQHGEYTACVQRGADFLLGQIVDYGKFDTTSSHYMYSHAIATQALCELYSFTADPRVGVGAQLAVDYLMYAQHLPTGGWRYLANQPGDTSVTGWVILALNAAFKAGLDAGGARATLRFLDSVTSSGYYQAGYMGPGVPTKRNDRLDAVAIVGRLMLGQNNSHAKVLIPAWRLRNRPPRPNSPDFYGWYYASIGMFQMGDEFWKAWNDALLPSLLKLQVVNEGPYLGSWNPDKHYGKQGGRIFQTALGVLMLTTYYRYDRVRPARLYPFTGDIAKEAAPFLQALEDVKDPVKRAAVRAKMIDQLGQSLTSVVIRILKERKAKLGLRRELAACLIIVAEPSHQAAVLALLDEPDHAIAKHLTLVLRRIATADGVPALSRALDHRNRDVRRLAAQALGRIGATAATAPLGRRLQKEKDGSCKAAIQQALQRIAHRDAIAVVVDDAFARAGDSGRGGRVEVLEGLDLLQNHGLGKKLLACRDREPKVYDACLAEIATHREAAAVAVLIAALPSVDQDTRAESVKLLRALTGVAHGFKAKDSDQARRVAVARWQAWWAKHTEQFVPHVR